MTQTIAKPELTAMLQCAVDKIRANHEMLSQLDSVGGDGDHGTTMLRAMVNLEKAVVASSEKNIYDLLGDIAWAVMGTDGGATGPLFGSFFMGMADPAKGKETLDAPTLAAMFAAGLANVQKQTKAQVGDKTMIDALAPACDAAVQAAGEGLDAVLEKAAAAATAGAAATKQLQARFGRAKNFGEKSIGSQDAGATSVSLIFQGFLEGRKK